MVALNSDGNISTTKCSCHQQLGGRCSHIAALLYLLSEVSLGAKPRISLPSTSKPQYWGMGAKSAKTPQRVQDADYGKKQKMDKYIGFDPRPPELRHTSNQEVYDFVKSNQISSSVNGYLSNWDSILQIEYEDYTIDFDRRMVIYDLRQQWITNMRINLEQYESDRLTNASAYHITGTEDQSESDVWFRERKG